MIVCSDVPFVNGGHRKIAFSLLRALRDEGVEVEPWFTAQNPFGKQFQAYLSNMFTDLTEDGLGRKIDGVIALRYPSYCVKAHTLVVWLAHRMREYYDLWDEFKERISLLGKVKESIRRALIHIFDGRCLKRARKIFTISQTVKKRLERWGGLEAEVLYPPPPQRNYRSEAYENYFLFPSRLSRLKRQDIAIRAMKWVKGARLVIAGEGEERERLLAIAEEEGLMDRVVFTGFLRDEELTEVYSKSLGVVFIPYMEDYGFVTVEAFYSAKPVITFSDSGGPTELVVDEENGFVVEPSPETLAEKMNLLLSRKSLAKEMGQRALDIKGTIHWQYAVKVLKEAFI